VGQVNGRRLVEVMAAMDVPPERFRDNVHQLAADLAEQRRKTAEAESMLAASIRDALEIGIPAAEVAELAGVSRARVYQIRDGKR